MAALTEPWSKRHKAVTRNDREGLQYNLSNSFAQPTSQAELEQLSAYTSQRDSASPNWAVSMETTPMPKSEAGEEGDKP